MTDANEIRTSLEVGFPEGKLPEKYASLRGRDWRSIALMPEFPYEDAQFEVVIMEGSAVSRASVREANRVLKPEGRLVFTVNEKRGSEPGYTMPDVYAVVRDGFNIVDVKRPAWWRFGRDGHTLAITAKKKAWREYRGYAHGGACTLSPFKGGS